MLRYKYLASTSPLILAQNKAINDQAGTGREQHILFLLCAEPFVYIHAIPARILDHIQDL